MSFMKLVAALMLLASPAIVLYCFFLLEWSFTASVSCPLGASMGLIYLACHKDMEEIERVESELAGNGI